MTNNAKFNSLLRQAIKHHHYILFIYEGMERKVEPYHCGLLGGKEQLHAYQIAGDSISGGIPEWRNFEITKIKSLTIETESRFTERADYNPINSHYTEINIF